MFTPVAAGEVGSFGPIFSGYRYSISFSDLGCDVSGRRILETVTVSVLMSVILRG